MHDNDFYTVISSLVIGELARMRKCSNSTAEIGMQLVGSSPAATSLELAELASAVDRMFFPNEVGERDNLLRQGGARDWVRAWAEIVAAAFGKGTGHIAFRTSGSTGEPRMCIHRLSELEQEAAVHAAAFRGCRRVLALVPRHHIYGFLWTVMLPGKLGAEVLDARRWMISQLAAELKAGDLIVGTPGSLRNLSGATDRFPRFVKGVTSGEECPAALFQRIQQQGLDLTEVYGSSETGGVGFRQSPTLPFELFPFWKPGPSATSLLRQCQVELPDYLEWRDDRKFFIHGRRDGAVQVRGRNVFPALVAQRIASHPSVWDCSVRRMRPAEGDRLKAFVVMRTGNQPSAGGQTLMEEREQFELWLQNNLEPHERPGSITFGRELPRNELGKAADWEIADSNTAR